ncbi:MAG: hypothetical protein RSA71_02670, partial [Eubacterium sp.]
REGGFTGDRPNRGGGQKKRAAQNRNTTVYEESANVTLGDAFGNLFEGLSFGDDTDDGDKE